jgi:hypothetical protein
MRITGITLSTTQAELDETDFKSTTAFPRAKMAQESAVAFPMDLRGWQVHDSGALLPASASADDLGFAVGTFGTAPPKLVSSDGASTTVTQYARQSFQVPLEYQTGQTIQFVANVAMGTISDTTATLDVQVYAADKEGGIGSDLCTTSATSVNSATAADYTFAITGSGLAAGAWLDIRITAAITDSATGSGVTMSVNNTEIQCDVRG